MQERDTEWSAPTILRHIHGASVLLGTTVAQRYDIPQNWLWDACHMARVHWGTRCKGFHSKECLHYWFERSTRNSLERDQAWIGLGNCPEAAIWQATINLYSWVRKSLGDSLPKLHCVSVAYVTQESGARGVLWVRKVWFTFTQWMFAQETFGKRQKGERSPVVSLLPDSRKHLASRNPCILCHKHGGARTTYYLEVPMLRENGMRNRILMQPRKVQTN